MNLRDLIFAAFLVPVAALGGSSPNYSFTPTAVDSGGLGGISANYSIQFSDAPGGAGSSALYTVNTGFASELDLPRTLLDTSILENTSTGLIPFIADAAGPLSAVSSNQALVADAAIILGGSGTARTLFITPGLNQFGTTTITVTNGATGTAMSFVLTVLQASSVDTLSGLVLNGVALDQPFASGTTSYTASVDQSVTSLTVTPAATFSTAVVTVNGTVVNAGSTSQPIFLSAGANPISIVVTAQDGVTTLSYTVTITRGTPLAPVVTAGPLDLSVPAFTTATFSASATGSPAPAVQWQVSTDGGATFTNVTGATAGTFSFTAAPGDSGRQFRAVFTSIAGSAASNAAVLTVISAPVVTVPPVDQLVPAGQAATFTAAASGVPASTVQWQASTDNGTSFNDILGATSASFSFITSVAQNHYQYRAVFSNVAGNAITIAATLNVTAPPVVTLNPVSQTLAAGATATFTSTATGSPTPSAQWQVSIDNGMTFVNLVGATGSLCKFTTVAGDNGRQFRCAYVNATGSVTTSAAVLTVTSTPLVTVNPASQVLLAGSPATFTAAATGNPSPAVQWQVSTDGGATYASIVGAVSGTYSLSAAVAQSGWLYQAVFTNASGTATTSAATLVVNALPVVTLSPVSQSALAGNVVSFTSAATGTPAPVVQWQVSTDGGTSFANIMGATSSLYQFIATTGDAGKQFQAIYRNVAGSAITGTASLTVHIPSRPLITAPVAVAASGTTETLGAEVLSDGYLPITARGVVYSVTSVNPAPQQGGPGVVDMPASGTVGAFTVSAMGLLPAGAYSFAAYATNGEGTSYTTTATFTPDVPPSIGSISAPANGTYKNAQVLSFTVNFSKPVTAGTGGGLPALTLTIGSTLRSASYVSGSGTVSLVFQYTIDTADVDADGVVLASPLQLNGGTLRDALGTDAVLAFTPPDTSGLRVDGRVFFTAGNGADAAPDVGGSGTTVGTWESIRSGMAMSASGAIAFRGHLDLTGSVTALNYQGIWKSVDGLPSSTVLLARTGNAAPDAGGASYDLLPFNPVINNLGQTTFVGYLRAGTGSPAADVASLGGLWTELGTGASGLALMLRQGEVLGTHVVTQVAPSSWVASSSPASVAGPGYAVFNVELDSGASSATVRTRCTSTGATVNFQPAVLLQEGAAAPDGGTFAGLKGNASDPRMDAAGNVALLAYKADGSAGIYHQPMSGALHAVALTGAAAPGIVGGDTFTAFERPSLAAGGGHIAFRAFLAATGQGVYAGDPTAPAGLVALTKTGDTGLPGTPPGSKVNSVWSPFSNVGGHVAFRLSLLDAGSVETRAIATDTSGTLKIIAAAGQTAPGTGGDTFANFDHPVIGDGDQAAFPASTSGGIYGLWRQAPGGGALSLALKIGDSIDSNGTPKTVAAFIVIGTTTADRLNEVTPMDSVGRILVWVTYDSGDTGILLTRP